MSAVGCWIGGASNAIGGAAGTFNFWTDPWGNTFKTLQESARNLSQSVLPTVTKATLPDLNAEWFLKAYAVTFALAIFAAVVLLIPQVVRTARGVQAGRDLLDSIGIYFPLFLISAMFGPPFGAILVNFFSSLSESIIAWGITGSAGSITSEFQKMLSESDASGIAGGAVVGVFLMLFMLLGLLLVIIMLIIQLVTLYFTGVLLPLGLVWIIDPTKRKFGTKIVSIWIGVLASHPLLFLLLSFAYLMVSGSINVFGTGNALQKTVTLTVSLLALLMAGFAPLTLMKLAPVLPMGNGGAAGPGLNMPSIGAKNMTDADQRYGTDSPNDSKNSGGTTSGSAMDADAASDQPDTLTKAAAGSASTAGAGEGSAMAGGTAAAGTATGTATTEGLAAAGTVETATGAGAAIGIPTIVVAGMKAGYDKATDTANTVTDHATAAIDDHEEHFGRDYSS
jgi:type IV secretion system protein TrbL